LPRKPAAPEPITVKVYPHVVQVHTPTTELTGKRLMLNGTADSQLKFESLVAGLQATGAKVTVEYFDKDGKPDPAK